MGDSGELGYGVRTGSDNSSMRRTNAVVIDAVYKHF
jgi:hypothetical protein